MTKYWVDPPSGWMYGFPRVYDPEKDGSLNDFFRTHGVPENIIKIGHYRTWPYVPKQETT